MLQLEGQLDFPQATVYRDDERDVRFFVLPKVPLLRRDGDKAVFKFVKYRTLKPLPNGDVGAALVFMDIELALSPAAEADLRNKLVEVVKARRGPGDTSQLQAAQIELSKPQVSKASVAVEVLGGDGNLVQKVNHAGKPSMYGNNVVALSAELNQFGAPVFEAVMKSEGAGGVRVVYDLEFAARLPPVKATATWTASKFYSFFQEAHYEERFWSADDMSEKINELFVNSESRQVVIDPGALSSSDPEVVKLLDTIRSSIERQLDEAVKRNLLEAIPPESRDVSKIREEDFENIKRQVTVNKQSDVTIRYTEKQVTSVNVAPQANMSSLTTQGFNWGDYAIEADTDDPFFRRLNLSTNYVETLAGRSDGSAGYNNGYYPNPAFTGPTGLTTDGKFLYICDTGNQLIRYLQLTRDTNGYLVGTLAGGYNEEGSTDAIGTAARFKGPRGITTDGFWLYISDTGNNPVRTVVLTSPYQVSTLAGKSGASGSDNGTGSLARFSALTGITSSGTKLVVADSGNNLIRQIR